MVGLKLVSGTGEAQVQMELSARHLTELVDVIVGKHFYSSVL